MKQLFVMAIAAGILAALPLQQSYAQYGDSETVASEATLQRCAELDIPRAQCNDVAVLPDEAEDKAAETKRQRSLLKAILAYHSM